MLTRKTLIDYHTILLINKVITLYITLEIRVKYISYKIRHCQNR